MAKKTRAKKPNSPFVTDAMGEMSESSSPSRQKIFTNETHFPLEGEYFFCEKKVSDVLIFFVHFYGGNKKALQRHVKFINRIGFDAFAFNAKDQIKSFRDLPFTAHGSFGLKHAVADQIEDQLNRLPGQKVIFSFSNPTAAAIESMVRRNCHDVVGLIADSGPSGHYLRSAMNLFHQEKSFGFLPLRIALAPFLSMFWSPSLHLDIHKDLEKLPENFPVLTIQCGQDQLIPPDHIDEVFARHHQLNWQKLILPKAEHLTGLRDFATDYEPAVEKFLHQFTNSTV